MCPAQQVVNVNDDNIVSSPSRCREEFQHVGAALQIEVGVASMMTGSGCGGPHFVPLDSRHKVYEEPSEEVIFDNQALLHHHRIPERTSLLASRPCLTWRE